MGAVGVGVVASLRDRRRASGLRSHADLVGIAAVLSSALAVIPELAAPAPWAVVLLGSVAMAGGGALYARLTSDMLARVAPEHVSMAGGLTAAAQSLAYVIANPLIGRAVDVAHSYAGVMIVLGLVNLPGALVWMRWPLRRAAARWPT